LAALVLLAAGCQTTVRMPGQTHEGPLSAATVVERALASTLRKHVRHFSEEIGERHAGKPLNLDRARAHVIAQFEAMGLHVDRHRFAVDGQWFENLTAVIPASPGARIDDRVVLVGAHYDSAPGTPGANDNASGVAAMLALAERFSRTPARRTLWFVAFVNEEPPFFGRESMGSRRYMTDRKANLQKVAAMISLETMGYFSDAEGSQRYPWPLRWFYPDRGNFIAVVANHESRDLVRWLVGDLRSHMRFPVDGAALPRSKEPIGWSDHRNFWDLQIPALMVTDTAPFRYPHYHRTTDTFDKVDYDRLARVVGGLGNTLEHLCASALLPSWRD
jgi:hypothetical protein